MTHPTQANQAYTLVVLGIPQDDNLVEALFSLKDLFADRVNIREALLITCQGEALHQMISIMLGELRNPSQEQKQDPAPSDPGSSPPPADIYPTEAAWQTARQLLEDPPAEEAQPVENMRTCEVCSKPFAPRSKRSTVCSRQCQNRKYRSAHSFRTVVTVDAGQVSADETNSAPQAGQVRKWRLPDGKEVDDVSHLLKKGKLQAGDVVTHRDRGTYLVTNNNGKPTLHRQQAQV